MIRYMVIEHFFGGRQDKVYERFASRGRMLPEGLFFIESWLAKDGTHCYQVMETEDISRFDVWVKNWDDLVRFEIIELGDKPV